MYQPDFTQLLKVLRREKPDRPTLFEFIMGGPVLEKLAGGWFEEDAPTIEKLRFFIRAFHGGGYDYTILPIWHMGLVGFPKDESTEKDSRSLNEGSVIHDEASFEAYAWQDLDMAAYDMFETLKADIPEGMKLVVSCNGGVEENLIELIGYQDLCFMQVDEPELVKQIADAIGSRLLAHYQKVLEYDTVGGIIVNDDWGFKTQTMMPPAFLREYVIPWHRKFAEAAHAAGRPVMLHSCGNLREVWDDIIDDIKIDGKHSYEDCIQPVEEAYEEYGNRIAILGGIDMDFLSRKTPEEIYKRSAEMIERTGGCRGYALGSGNSITGYIPIENYEAMTRAALESR